MTAPHLLRIALVGPARFPIAQPFIGGLEAHIWSLARALSAHGHAVTLFAAAGSDRSVAEHVVEFPVIESEDPRRRDVSEAADLVAAEDLAYRGVLDDLIAGGAADFDVIHNHSLHPEPIAAAAELDVAVISTFHTPPIERVARAVEQSRAHNLCLTAVSRHAAEMWSSVARDVRVVHNGVDVDDWRFGAGGSRLVWSGRLVPEKGADLAISAAALAGRPLDLAGPVIDDEYFRRQIEPRLGPDVRYLGHLTQEQLTDTVGRAAVALVTPRWDEPYGLVVAEALACGTPVAAFARGGIPEIVSDRCARLARAGDVAALARAVADASTLDRREVRRHAERHCSMARMVASYEALYRSRVPRRLTKPHPSRTRAPHGHGVVPAHPGRLPVGRLGQPIAST